MTILADNKIFELLRNEELIVHPILDNRQIKGARIDLRLDNVLYFFRRLEREYYNPLDYVDTTPPDYVQERKIPYSENFVLHPNDYALAPVFEFVHIPKGFMGRLDGRSSLGRLGIVVHSTAGAVDPGYSGPLIMELKNYGMLPVCLYPLMRIATLTLHKLEGETDSYDGKYKGLQKDFGVEARLHKDRDLIAIKKHLDTNSYI